MFADWQELDMREAHLADVIDQLGAQRGVVEHVVLEGAPPTAQVNLVNRHGLGALVRPAGGDPARIAPFVADLSINH